MCDVTRKEDPGTDIPKQECKQTMESDADRPVLGKKMCCIKTTVRVICAVTVVVDSVLLLVYTNHQQEHRNCSRDDGADDMCRPVAATF